MPVEIDIAKVARLARLELSDDDLAHYGAQLEVILEHASRVQALDTADVEPTSHALDMANAFRADEPRASLDRDEVLSQAPDRDGDYFLVPRILEEEG